MLKIIISYVVLFMGAFVLPSHGQNAFEKGDIVINAGIGFGTTSTGLSFSGLGPPFGFGAEYGISDDIGLSGDFGVNSGNGLTITYIGARGSYHFNRILELNSGDLDLYAGLGAYYRSFNLDSDFLGLLDDEVYVAFHIGGRYYFNEKFGVQAELGNSYGWFKIGGIFNL